MALRDQPYLPLYIQDFMTDEKLIHCSASSTGVYIRLMCLMHKSENYGKILLKQKFKQSDNQINNFAKFVAKSLPYSVSEIEDALIELTDEGVLIVTDDFLVQKRMVKDFEISNIRALSGSKGGKKTKDKLSDFANTFAIAKIEANTENENKDINITIKGVDIFFKDLPNSVLFENITRDLNFTKEKLNSFVPKFRLACKTEYPNFPEFANHFKNWARKESEKEKPTIKRTGLV